MEMKKNTMENMTEKELAIKMANRALDVPNADPDSDICTISRQFLRALELTSSGSVAAPKEEESKGSMHLRHKLELGKEIDVLRQQLKEREEALKELLPMAEWKLQSTLDYLTSFSETIETEPEKYNECDRLKAIIERARKTLNKEF